MKHPVKKQSYLKFFIGLTLVIVGCIAVSLAIIFGGDWTGYLFVGGTLSAATGIAIARTDFIEVIISLLSW